MAAKTIDEYIAGLGGDWRSDAVARLRTIVDTAAPEASSTIKWAGILEGEGERMKHLTLREGDAIPADELAGFVRQAVALNREHGSPARTR